MGLIIGRGYQIKEFPDIVDIGRVKEFERVSS